MIWSRGADYRLKSIFNNIVIKLLILFPVKVLKYDRKCTQKLARSRLVKKYCGVSESKGRIQYGKLHPTKYRNSNLKTRCKFSFWWLGRQQRQRDHSSVFWGAHWHSQQTLCLYIRPARQSYRNFWQKVWSLVRPARFVVTSCTWCEASKYYYMMR